MLIRTVGGDTWSARDAATRHVRSGDRARGWNARGGRACRGRAGSRAHPGGLARCGSAAARPSGGRTLVRSRLCAPFALHCKSLSVDDPAKEDPCLTGEVLA